MRISTYRSFAAVLHAFLYAGTYRCADHGHPLTGRKRGKTSPGVVGWVEGETVLRTRFAERKLPAMPLPSPLRGCRVWLRTTTTHWLVLPTAGIGFRQRYPQATVGSALPAHHPAATGDADFPSTATMPSAGGDRSAACLPTILRLIIRSSGLYFTVSGSPYAVVTTYGYTFVFVRGPSAATYLPYLAQASRFFCWLLAVTPVGCDAGSSVLWLRLASGSTYRQQRFRSPGCAGSALRTCCHHTSAGGSFCRSVYHTTSYSPAHATCTCPGKHYSGASSPASPV